MSMALDGGAADLRTWLVVTVVFLRLVSLGWIVFSEFESRDRAINRWPLNRLLAWADDRSG